MIEDLDCGLRAWFHIVLWNEARLVIMDMSCFIGFSYPEYAWWHAAKQVMSFIYGALIGPTWRIDFKLINLSFSICFTSIYTSWIKCKEWIISFLFYIFHLTNTTYPLLKKGWVLWWFLWKVCCFFFFILSDLLSLQL